MLNGTPTASSSGTDTGDGTTTGGTNTGGTTNGDCTSETEPNDKQNDANTIDGSICGSITPRGDTDWLTFTLKPTTQTLSLQFSGRVRLRVNVQGKGTTELTPDSAGQVPFVKNTPYYVQVAAFSDSDTAQPWTVTVVEK